MCSRILAATIRAKMGWPGYHLVLCMKSQPLLVGLVPLVAALTIISAGTGLFWQDDGAPFAFTIVHGQVVQIYGKGLYQYDA